MKKYSLMIKINKMSNQEILEEAVKSFELNDIITKMFSQRRDREIRLEQEKRYKNYKEAM